MGDIAIRVDNLSKEYKIAAVQYRHDTLRDEVMEGLRSVFRRNGRAYSKKDSFWALKDVSFEVKQGEVIGIIGSNGAGKSTLLKILSRITEPTSGRAEIRGSVGSLLEVGTGFDRELTGRENIFLSGAILGMKKSEIDHKFDEIVAFAEVEKFIDTPVKRYSSGMYMRLAFAVAAHLEPEILLVDEVLTVGDAAFQKKCLGKMGEVGKEGRTVLFVSHNMATIENLCRRAVLLHDGEILLEGVSRGVITHYLNAVLPSTIQSVALSERRDRSGNGVVRLTGFFIEDIRGNKLAAAQSGMDVVFAFSFQCPHGKQPRNVDIGFSIHSNLQQILFVLYSSYVGQMFDAVPGSGTFRCRVNHLPLSAGCYLVHARVVVGGEEADWLRNAVGYLEVEFGDYYRTGSKGFNGSAPLLVGGEWEVRPAIEN